MKHALQSFVPPGSYDDYLMFSSGGHSGQVYVIGLPSMRILKTIAVFTPEPWQGYGYGADWGDTVLEEGNPRCRQRDLTWGDTHHPALSETGGEYDGRWLYIQDRANGRMAMIDLRDFRTKQIVAVPNIQTSHGGMFVTPNSEYVHVSSKFPVPWPEGAYADVSEYQEKFRGASTWLKIDQETGRINMEESFQIELPPYSQDLADAGKLVSDGWGFIGSFNSEMATGGDSEGGEPLEAGASKNDFDYLHAINWKKAEEVVDAGGAEEMNGIRVIRMENAVEEGILYLIPEPKSPHGADVDPSGRYVVVGGKLDPNVTIYDIEKIKKPPEARTSRAPTHSASRSSISTPSWQARWRWAPARCTRSSTARATVTPACSWTALSPSSPWARTSSQRGKRRSRSIEKIPVHYNIGHLATAEGDTVSPDDNYMVALNKWSIDRYPVLGPLHPQNFQLIDLKGGNGPMELLSTCQSASASRTTRRSSRRTSSTRWRSTRLAPTPLTMEHSEYAVEVGEERTERDGNTVNRVHDRAAEPLHAGHHPCRRRATRWSST